MRVLQLFIQYEYVCNTTWYFELFFFDTAFTRGTLNQSCNNKFCEKLGIKNDHNICVAVSH